jgi:hypothetical protein
MSGRGGIQARSVLANTTATRRSRLVPEKGRVSNGQYGNQNLIIVLRVMVTWLVTPAGPPLNK